MLDFAPNDVQNEGVTWNFLVGLYLDDVTRLDATPVRDLKTLVPL